MLGEPFSKQKARLSLSLSVKMLTDSLQRRWKGLQLATALHKTNVSPRHIILMFLCSDVGTAGVMLAN